MSEIRLITKECHAIALPSTTETSSVRDRVHCGKAGTMEPWQKRLLDAIENDGRPQRTVSLAARLGPNFVSQFRANPNKGLIVTHFLKLTKALNVSPIYILTGAEMDPHTEELLEIVAEMPPSKLRSLIALLQQEAPKELQTSDKAAKSSA